MIIKNLYQLLTCRITKRSGYYITICNKIKITVSEIQVYKNRKQLLKMNKNL